MKKRKLMLGDNIESLKKLPDNSVDSVVTDPPYGLSFMSKKWDYDVPSVEFWKEVYRVLKPGGHVLSFGGTRTYHRMVVNIEDAGFEIRDQIQWIYGSGFPKSYNVGKIVDELQGWGTALKPANEPICVARKPLSESTIVKNILKWGTGGINIDGCRVGTEPIEVEELITDGRFPANIILECICTELIKGEKGEIVEHNGSGGIWNEGTKEPVGRTYNDIGDVHTDPNCPCRLLDEQSGESKSNTKQKVVEDKEAGQMYHRHEQPSNNYKQKVYVGDYSDKGGASRFFYQAKVSKAERNTGLDGFDDRVIEGRDVGQDERNVAYKPRPVSQKNTHPTVKPINLMAYLCRLITPAGGIVLDPFMGSGSTGIASQLEGFRFIGMEMDEDYFKISEARIESYEKYNTFIK